MTDRFRRPAPSWCTATAVRLLRLACREEDRAVLTEEEAARLVEAAALLDLYGQRLEARRAAADG